MEARDQLASLKHQPGPVITISREHGCDASVLGDLIAKRINSSFPESNKLWKCINKEILEEASKELKLSASKIADKVVTSSDNIIEDLLNSFSNHYKIPETKVLDTIKEVIQLYAHQGKVIIIGRGGVFISNDIPQSLHIKLTAPFNWRVARIESKFNISHDKAIAQCNALDEKRRIWNNRLSNVNTVDNVYDLILNSSTLSDKQMLDIIFTAMKGKKIIPNINI